MGAAIRDGLLAFAGAAGLVVMRHLMEAELSERIGPKHAKLPQRTGNRHGSTSGSVVLGGRKLAAARPRARSIDGTEIALDAWAVFSSTDLLDQVVAERMLAGVATRRHADVGEPLGAELEDGSSGTSRSAVSRRFVRATRRALDELMARELSDLDVAVVMVDGIQIAGQCCVAALVITSDGRKVPVGLWLGDTENRTVVSDLLADLTARGLSSERGLLVVIDGAKALASAVRAVFGEQALIQRCTLHKRRNVADYLPQELAARIDRRLAGAFSQPDPATGLARAKAIATELQRDHPDAAASRREGLADMFTVRRLGLSGRLTRSLTTTNPIESMISIARTTLGNVKRWRDGRMQKRWVAAGMLEAERSFRRVKGCSEMPVLVAALRQATGVKPTNYHEEAACSRPGSPPDFNNGRDILTKPSARMKRWPKRRRMHAKANSTRLARPWPGPRLWQPRLVGGPRGSGPGGRWMGVAEDVAFSLLLAARVQQYLVTSG